MIIVSFSFGLFFFFRVGMWLVVGGFIGVVLSVVG
jgi:hypothetical protein